MSPRHAETRLFGAWASTLRQDHAAQKASDQAALSKNMHTRNILWKRTHYDMHFVSSSRLSSMNFKQQLCIFNQQ